MNTASIDVNEGNFTSIASYDSRTYLVVCRDALLAAMMPIADVRANVGNLEPEGVHRTEEACISDEQLMQIQKTGIRSVGADERVVVALPFNRDRHSLFL